MNWVGKKIYWHPELMEYRQKAVGKLADAGAEQYTLTEKAEPGADLIIANGEELAGIFCTPVLRPEMMPDRLCCGIVANEQSDDQILDVLETWRDAKETALHLQLEKLPVIDVETTRSLVRLAGSDILRIGREKFLNSAQKYLRRMEIGKNTGDLEEVTKVLHTLKGSSGTIGARQLSQASKQIEESVENGFNATNFSNQLSLLRMFLEYFRYQSKEWGKTSTNGETNFNGG